MELTHNATFIKSNSRLIAPFILSGLAIAIIYLALAPKTYQASWQLQMAQLATNNIEEPEMLVQRLRSPSSYSPELSKLCGIIDADNADYLGGRLEVRAVKGVSKTVAIKFYAGSPKEAHQCAQSIIAMIVQSQNNQIKELLAGRQEQLMQYQQALQNEQQQLAKITNVELSRVAYLAKLDQLSWLRTRIDALQEEALLSLKRPTKLTAPVYVSNHPVAPEPLLITMMGGLLGVILGVLFALLRDNLHKSA